PGSREWNTIESDSSISSFPIANRKLTSFHVQGNSSGRCSTKKLKVTAFGIQENSVTRVTPRGYTKASNCCGKIYLICRYHFHNRKQIRLNDRPELKMDHAGLVATPDKGKHPTDP
ncbi:MAG: hypothetical protein VB046_14030, partial [Paludibacter sp.]|nr:hypothetical protein [Paludibacter sp.]